MTSAINTDQLYAKPDDNGHDQRIFIDQESKPGSLYLVGIWLFFVPFGLDFKDRGVIENPILLRTIIVALSLLGFMLAIYARNNFSGIEKRASKIHSMLRLWVFFSAYIIFITYLRSLEFLTIVQSGATYVFMAMSMFLLTRHINAGLSTRSFWSPIVVMSIISVVWTLYFGRYVSNSFSEEDAFSFIEDIRYTILSGAILPMVAYSIFNLSRFKQVILNSSFLIFLMSIILISKTRGLLPGIACVVAFAIFSSPYRTRTLVITLIFTFLTIVISTMLPLILHEYDIVAIWKVRLFGVDENFFDATKYMRLAEYYAQIKILLSDIQSFIFGYGFLQGFYWDPYLHDFLLANGYRDDYSATYTTGGHSAWITSLFHGGLIAGWIPFISISYLIYLAFKISVSNKKTRTALSYWGGLSFAILVAIWIPSSFSSFFTDRILPMTLGAAIIQATYEFERMRAKVSR